jgi:hypothetical protein
MCDFTGSRTQSDATPGRCTKTGGYLAYAEINELIKRGVGARTFYDAKSNTDIMIYKGIYSPSRRSKILSLRLLNHFTNRLGFQGDYVSYMTLLTKKTRREEWKKRNFAGSIDWAVDLQTFTADEYDDTKPERPESGVGCIGGRDLSYTSGDLCEFTCFFGFCPESLCECKFQGKLQPLPQGIPSREVVAMDEYDVEMNRLCKFSCKYGYCPDDLCITPLNGPDMSGPLEVGDEENAHNRTEDIIANNKKCVIYRDPRVEDTRLESCKKVCKEEIEEAEEEGRTFNYGCVGFWPGQGSIPWQQPPGSSAVAEGRCMCDNWVLNELADTVLEAMPMIAQVCIEDAGTSI